ncbi:hypothetical protein C5746_35080 [Streptomyces atratus]|uniref:Uncharacterized protein n=1 Tax=Streptomyces atratus TaxID=1893 RepID=A0A2Z5JLJ8_STRAR|nr:hypothetical protein C5746_35080 [Streptomyces atratus]
MGSPDGSGSPRVYRKPLRFGLYKTDNRTVIWQEADPLRWTGGGMRQSLKRGADEQFFGGGEQNGNFSHRDQVRHVGNNTDWNARQVRSHHHKDRCERGQLRGQAVRPLVPCHRARQ